jgi:branched-chain amino acid transport system permease protein
MDIYLQLVANGLLIGGIYALVSIGLTLIYGVMKIINFAHGEFIMLSMYFTYWLNVKLGFDPYLSLLLLIPTMFVVGALAYRFFLHPIIHHRQQLTILMTMGLMILFQNIALVLWKADVRGVRLPYSMKTIGLGSVRLSVTRLISFGVALLTAGALKAFLDKTWIGRSIKAASQSPVAARLMGVDTRKTYMVAFGVGIAVVGIAGVSLSPIFNVYPLVGSQFGTLSFVIVVLGGLGSVAGAFIGGLIIGLVSTFSGFFVPTGFTEAIYLCIFLLVLLFKPNGLFGKATAGGGK